MAKPVQKPSGFDVQAVRAQFPALAGGDVAFLDSAASAQKPEVVLRTMDAAYSTHYANVHRGLYKFSQEMTIKFEAARETVARFLNAPKTDEIVFTRNATEAINLVAATWGRQNLAAGDEVILTALEHHANIVPWQLLREEKGIVIKVVPLRDDGAVNMEAYQSLLSEKTKLVAVSHMSNALGVIQPVREITRLAKEAGARVLIDGAQAVVHLPVDVVDVGCDFYVFTGHKLYGPTGIGVLWGRYDLLAAMPPYQGGGEMIERVTFEHSTWKKPPARFEAGTPAIVETIGLSAAIAFVNGVGKAAIQAHEEDLLSYATKAVTEPGDVTVYGTAADKAGILSFNLDSVHPSDAGMILDQCGVAVRTGHHCAQPLMETLEVAATIRASFGIYNTREDVDRLVAGLKKVREILL